MWRIVPLTLALCLGPTLDSLYFFGLGGARVGGLISPFQAINGVLLVAMFLVLPGNRIAAISQRSILFPIFLIASYAVMTCVASPHPQENLVDGLQMFFLYLVFLNTLEFSRRGWLSRTWYSIVPWVVLGLTILSQGLGIHFGVRGTGTYALAATGVAGRPSSIGVFAVCVLPWFLALSERGISNVVGAFMAFGAITVSMRRNAFVVTSITLSVMLTYLIIHTRKVGQKLMLTGLTGAVCITFAAFLLCTPMGEGFIHRLEDLNLLEGGTAAGRTEFMTVAWEHLLSRGIVASVLGEGSGAIADVIEAGWGSHIGAHNGWLDTASAFGLVGIICLVWFHVSVARLAMRSNGRCRTAAVGAALVVWIGGMVMNSLYAPSYALLYSLLGIVAADTPTWSRSALVESQSWRAVSPRVSRFSRPSCPMNKT